MPIPESHGFASAAGRDAPHFRRSIIRRLSLSPDPAQRPVFFATMNRLPFMVGKSSVSFVSIVHRISAGMLVRQPTFFAH
jgi:hypothetical protein